MKVKNIFAKIGTFAMVIVMLTMMLPSAALAAPLAPAGLAAVVVAGPPLGVSLTWADNSANEFGFRVMRAVAPSTTFTHITAPTGLGVNSVSFTDTTVQPGVTYSYQIVAFNADPTPDSPPSNTVTITATVPAAPTGLAATQQAGPPQTVTLSWTDASNNEIGFLIERADNAGFTVNKVVNARVTNVAAAPVIFVDADVIPGATYFYRVSALAASGVSAPSNTVTLTITAAAGMQAGPVIPIAGFTQPNGFPLYYQDTLGTKLNLLPITAVNFADAVIVDNPTTPANEANPYSIALGFGTEAFYYLAAPDMTPAAAIGVTGIIEFAIEAIFGSPDGTAFPTTEAVMARTRIRLTLPVGGDWTIQTPYGTRTFPGVVIGAAGGNLGGATLDINFTEDIGAIPRIFSGANSPIAPFDPVLNPNPVNVFLRPVAAQLGAPAVFGDGVTPTAVTGGPQRNSVIITGPPGSGIGPITLNTWTINGKFLAAPVVPGFNKSISPPLSVAFTDTTTGTPTSWTWDFGDGTTSTLRNPIHTYAAAGNYIVRLTAANAGGSATTSQMVSFFTAPSAAFTAGPGATQFTVDFTSNTTGNPTGWLWNFGDGTTSTLQNPSHAFATGGGFNVTLSVFNPAGTATATQLFVIGPPLVPTNLTATVVSATQINVSFVDNALNENGFRIDRAENNLFTLNLLSRNITTPSAGAGLTVNFIDTANITTNKIYFYRVVAVGATASSEASVTAQATVGTPPPNTPVLTATLLSGTQIRLNWTDPNTNEEFYHVHRSGTADFAILTHTVLPANTVTFTDNVTAGATFFYRVHAMNALGSSNNSADVQISTTVPAAPASLTGIVASPTSVTLNWSAATSASGYAVERSIGSGNVTFTLLAAGTLGNVLSFTDTTVSANQVYNYRVFATNVVGNSTGASPTATVNMLFPVAPVLSPAVANTNGTVTLNWNNVLDEAGYRVERSTNNVTFTVLATLAVDSGTYTDNTTTQPTVFFYRVTAFNGLGNGISNVVQVTADKIPAAPAGLAAVLAGPTTVNLNWTDPATNEANYVIQRAADAAFTTSVVNVTRPANTTAYSDNTVALGQTWFYRVFSNSTVGSSNFSNTVNISVAVPGAPAGLTGIVASPASVTLNWTAGSGATGYKVERSIGSGNVTFTLLAAGTVGNVLTFTDATVSVNNTYNYRVFATNVVGNSTSPSNTAIVNMLLPDAPVLSPAVANTNGTVTLTWNNVADETGYRVERSTNNVTFTVLATLAVDSVTYTDNTTTQPTIFFYRVAAFNGLSTPGAGISNVVQVTADKIPAAPTGLAAVLASNTTVNLNWTDPATNEANYVIQRAADAAFTTSVVNVTRPANTIAYSDNTVALGQTWFYRVFSNSTVGTSNFSNTLNISVAVPATPAGLTGIVATPTSVNLTWTAGNGASGYKVERSIGSGNVTFTLLAAGTVGNVLTFTDATVSINNTYNYRVLATNVIGNSTGTSPTAIVNMLVPLAPILNPGVANANGTVSLAWNNVADETGYRVERGTVNTTFTTLAVLGTNITAYTDTAAAPATSYFYRVTAFNGLGSLGSNMIAVTSATPAAPPTAPTGLTANAAAFNTVNLVWLDNATNEAGFRIERSSNNGATFSLLPSVLGLGVTTFSDTTAAASTIYIYRVFAFNIAGNSTAAVASPVTTPAAPPPVIIGGGGGGGGGIVAPPTVTVIAPSGLAGNLSINSNGTVQSGARLTNDNVTLDIPAGTTMRVGANPISSLSQSIVAAPPAAPAGKVILSAHEFGPSGAVFTPAITMTLKFDPARLPAGVNMINLVIVFFDGTNWVTLPTVVDPATNTATANVSHFSIYALQYEVPPPAVRITSPAAGASVLAGNVTVTAAADNFNLVAPGGNNTAGQGHLHYYLDVTIPTAQGVPAVTAAGTYQATPGTSAVWPNVQPGTHTLGVQLVNSDHTPLNPPVFTTVNITVTAPPPAVRITSPAAGASVPAGNVTVTVAADNFNLVPPGGNNTAGQGHLHYYLDVAVPTTPGVPAVTAAGTYQAAPGTSAVWPNVQPGTHTLGVQLVNSDHTPLNPPVFTTITITVTAPPAPPPAVRITSPAAGASVPAGNVTVTIAADNFNLVPPGGNVTAGQGHLHYYLDVAVPTTPGAPAVTAAGTYKATPGTSAVWENVAPGTHNLSVQLVNANHTPLVPPVFATITITVTAPPAPPPAVRITSPANGATLQPGDITVSVAADNFNLVPPGGNVTAGQGHLHYYLDVTVPTAPGAPAVTAAGTYQALPGTSAVWANVQPGTHTLSVQLVNNDHTPLNPPVFATVTITVPAPVVTPPVETPPVVTPPVETPPVVTPPVETPPVVTPPVVEPVPAETPATNWGLIAGIAAAVLVITGIVVIITRRRVIQ